MDNKPIHYDGSLHSINEVETEGKSEPLAITDEIRAKISGNPYLLESDE